MFAIIGRLTLTAQHKRVAVSVLLPVLLVVLAMINIDCRKEPAGVIDPDYSTPYILSMSLSESKINLDTSTTSALVRNGDGTYTITDSIYASVIDPVDGHNLQSCSFRLTPPGYGYPTLTGTLTRTEVAGNGATFAGAVRFNLKRSEIGNYTIAITVKGISDFVSNSTGLTLFVTRRNARPAVSNLTLPDTLHRPNSGYKLIRFAINAADSDGLGDIQKVFFKSINSTSPDFEQPMFDDGNLSLDGDSVALDGRFSRLLILDSTATLGRKEFRFWARDNSGALSDSLIGFTVITSP